MLETLFQNTISIEVIRIKANTATVAVAVAEVTNVMSVLDVVYISSCYTWL